MGSYTAVIRYQKKIWLHDSWYFMHSYCKQVVNIELFLFTNKAFHLSLKYRRSCTCGDHAWMEDSIMMVLITHVVALHFMQKTNYQGWGNYVHNFLHYSIYNYLHYAADSMDHSQTRSLLKQSSISILKWYFITLYYKYNIKQLKNINLYSMMFWTS